ncbi:hypothetical protein PVAP13_3NG200600 [Panicum virgatum]|uniref:Uncharacterized protein n=1 Tax=Panicum virgatum TaxID=38727 RepID=A0A8T0U7T7_PANVG|nr:hypothetical protein PVAP13_3NG200600 [Panicum virgatum]
MEYYLTPSSVFSFGTLHRTGGKGQYSCSSQGSTATPSKEKQIPTLPIRRMQQIFFALLQLQSSTNGLYFCIQG